MIKVILVFLVITIFTLGIVLFVTSLSATTQTLPENRLSKGKFLNEYIEHKMGLSQIFKVLVAYSKDKREAAEPSQKIPVIPLSDSSLTSEQGDLLFRLGHSTMLMRLSGKYFLTDPVFSERASPVQWAGPKRFHPSPIDIASLPHISVVIISHDHYDHLDFAAIKQLADKVDQFVVPLNVGKRLKDWGIEQQKISELDWWQEITVGEVTLAATPAQHFSGRSIFDSDKTLWASWVIKSARSNLFFSGDSGYFKGFQEIGDRYGPFDITMVETGAYNELWSDIHMMPEESLQAHIDLQGQWMMPIHNGTFDLALHDWHTPFDEIEKLADQAAVSLLTPQFGQIIHLDNIQKLAPWWRDVK